MRNTHTRKTTPIVKLATFVWAFMLIVHVPALPHAATLEASQQAFEHTYQQLLAKPDDLDLTLKYAELAVDIGDYEAAIPPLERILMSNPELPKIKLELGILYYLLGSYDLSKSYFKDVKASASAQDDMKQQADSYLQKM